MNWLITQRNVFLCWMLCFMAFSGWAQNYTHTIASKQAFYALSGLPLSIKYTNIQAVKVVYDLQTQQLFFVDGNTYAFHHTFCQYELKDYSSLSQYNTNNYGIGKYRKYLLGNLNYIPEKEVWFLELAPSDLMTTAHIIAFWHEVTQAILFDAEIYFALNTQRLLGLKSELAEQINVITSAQIHGAQPYQVVNKGVAEGYLIYANENDSVWNTLTDSHIVILDHTPLTLPKVAGVLVTAHQTPLSHLSILGKNRNIPIGVYTQALNDSVVLSLLNNRVRLTVSDQEIGLEKITEFRFHPPKVKPIKLKFDTTKTGLFAVHMLTRRSAKYVGNKAAYVGELSRVAKEGDFKVPENGFAIPFYYYQQHVKASGVAHKINYLLAHKNTLPKDSVISVLKEIRTKIKGQPVDENLLGLVVEMAEKQGGYKRLRFRSSTNAEDARGFSGAGLYASKTGIVGDENKSVEKALKKVWSSLWSEAAFLERELYKIDHKQVFMGVLVHRSFPSEWANGVAITANLYRPENNGYVVNVQIGENSVVKPDSGVVCDQLVCYPDEERNLYSQNGTVEVITTSSLTDKGLVLTEKQLAELASALYAIKQHFYFSPIGEGVYNDFALDVEFKFDGADQQLYIKQARVYPN